MWLKNPHSALTGLFFLTVSGSGGSDILLITSAFEIGRNIVVPYSESGLVLYPFTLQKPPNPIEKNSEGIISSLYYSYLEILRAVSSTTYNLPNAIFHVCVHNMIGRLRFSVPSRRIWKPLNSDRK
jgi:hypothetical protein